MNELGPVAWPPDPIKTERLVLRQPRGSGSGGGEVALGYMFQPEAWGRGCAAERWYGVWS
jgi:hypothetical protein